MEQYIFTELSNGWISFKSGIFNNFISIRIATPVTFGRKWNKLFLKMFIKNAIDNEDNFHIFWVTKMEFICKLHAFMLKLVKNPDL